jgi:hypothetical protein
MVFQHRHLVIFLPEEGHVEGANLVRIFPFPELMIVAEVVPLWRRTNWVLK